MRAKKPSKSNQFNICVVGAGHVGLPAAASFAELGHKVICVDNDVKRIVALKKLQMPFFEPDMEELVEKNFKKGNLEFLSSLDEAIARSEVIFIAVGTPPMPDGSADLTAIENVAHAIARNLNGYKLVVEKSTVPVQTGKKIQETIARYKKTDAICDVASNPEFLREGKAVYDFFYPDRIVIGTSSKRAEDILRSIYSKLKAQIVVTDINTAELIKHASNSFLAMKISFINAVSRVCDLAGADVKKVATAMGFDKRINPQFLNAGIGWGGFCFPKDVEAFIYISKKLGYDFDLLKEVRNVNYDQRKYFVNKIKENLWILKDKKVAILGLAFKPDTDDMRFAPSLDIVDFLLKEGANLFLYDPKPQEAKKVFTHAGIVFSKNPYEAVKGADCVCFLTEWKELLEIDFDKVKRLVNHPLIADGRNMFNRKDITAKGFEYIALGA